MSTATRFVSVGYFPYSLPSEVAQPGTVSNLTLAQVMDFFWNLETFSLTFTGTVTNGSGTYNFGQTATAFPPAGTVMDQGKFYQGGPFPAASSVVSFASLPQAALQPWQRVCQTGTFFGFRYNKSSAPGTNFIDLSFEVATDLSNAGKYAIAYQLSALLNGSGGLSGVFFQQPGGGSGGTLGNSGNMTIGGISFPWEFYYDPPDTFTGGTLSATSTSFTY